MEKIRRELITPERAKALLLMNTQNRKPSPVVVQAYADKMRTGHWDELSNDPIVVNKWGVLENGQHRLLAIIKSGISVVMMIITGSEPCSVYDRGSGRTLRNVMEFRGLKEYATNDIIGITNMIMFCMFGNIATRKNDALAEQYIRDYGETLEIAARISARGSSKTNCTRKSAPAAAIYAALRNGIDSSVLCEFSDVVNTGFANGQWQTAPVALRNQLLDLKGRKYVAGQTVDDAKLALMNITQRAILDFTSHIGRKRAYPLTLEDPHKQIYMKKVLEDDEPKYKGFVMINE